MKLAVTGGAGFLGYHLCNQLAYDFDEIRIIDIAPINPEEYPSSATYRSVDVRDAVLLNRNLREIDLVIHAASALPRWKQTEILDANVGGARNVLEAAKTNNISRVIFISSTTVYGASHRNPVQESDPLEGIGIYGNSKVEAEKVFLAYRKQGLCTPIVRPKTFIGSGRLGVFQILFDWIESGKKIPLIGEGNNRYQLLDVEDLVDAVKFMMYGDAHLCNDIFNVGAERFGTVREDVMTLCQFAGTGSTVLPTPAKLVKATLALFDKLKVSPLYDLIYSTADQDSYISIDKVKKAFGWLPRYSNAEALIRSYQWYRDNKDKLLSEGVTHRVPWKQGILSLVKKIL